eukprot:2353684-Pyramimonas_sp.AAC.1
MVMICLTQLELQISYRAVEHRNQKKNIGRATRHLDSFAISAEANPLFMLCIFLEMELVFLHLTRAADQIQSS